MLLVAFSIAQAFAADLNPETARAWDRYVESVRAQMQARLGPMASFLWAAESADRLRLLRSGQVVVLPAGGQAPKRIPGGLIHHWIGAVFVPGASVAKVASTLQDYDRYKDYYSNVVESRFLGRDGSIDRFSTVETHQALVSRIALDADCSTTYTQAGEKRGYSISYTTRLQQIQNYGGPGQRELGNAAPKAYLWGLSTISRYEERDGGVYVEMEAMALSRDIPGWLRWLVDPFVRKAAAEALTTWLVQTRHAVLAEPPDSSISAY